MEKELYLNTQQEVVIITNLITKLKLKEFIETAERADTIGLILDPSLWMRSTKAINTIMDLAKGLQSFQTKAIQILKEAEQGVKP